MVATLIQTNFFIERQQFAVNARPQESVFREFLQFLLKLSLSTTNDRRENHDAFTFRQSEHVLNDLIDTLARDRSPAYGAMRLADGREEQPHVIVDLGDSAYCGSWTARNCLLLD